MQSTQCSWTLLSVSKQIGVWRLAFGDWSLEFWLCRHGDSTQVHWAMAGCALIPCSRCARNGNGNGCTNSAPGSGWSCPRHDWTWVDVNAYMPLWGAFRVPFCAGLLVRHATSRVVAGGEIIFAWLGGDWWERETPREGGREGGWVVSDRWGLRGRSGGRSRSRSRGFSMWEWIFGRIRRGEDSFSLAWVMMACF